MRRELDRGGQVYYLHNRTETIDQTAAKFVLFWAKRSASAPPTAMLDQEQLAIS